MLRFVRHSSFKSLTALQKPVFDVKGIILRLPEMEESIRRRALGNSAQLQFIIEQRPVEMDLQAQRNKLVSERKQLGFQLGLADANQKASIQESLKAMKAEISSLDSKLELLSEQIHTALESLPNWLSPEVPADSDVPELVEVINGASEEAVEQSLPKGSPTHREIGLDLGIMEFDRASKISGSSWYYLLGDGALLEQALVQFALSEARRAGYQMVIPPLIVKSEIVGACGFKPRDQNDEKQVYALAGEDLALTATAEIPMGALHSLSVITPRKYVGVSRAYRAEAGARGKDTQGLYRVHEFTKVELYHFSDPESAQQELQDIRALQTSIITKLGLKARMLNMPTTDLGAPALRKYDCEAWMPGRGSWGELTLCLNCGDYQARRLGIRQRKEGKLEYLHTLNGTAMAVPRVIVAILEQFYDPATKTVQIPEVLRPYMDSKTEIKKESE